MSRAGEMDTRVRRVCCLASPSLHDNLFLAIYAISNFITLLTFYYIYLLSFRTTHVTSSILSLPGEISTVANPNFDYGVTTVYVLHVNVSDGQLDDVQDLTINIDDVNYDIILYNLPDAISVGELTTGVIFTVNATDPDGLTLGYAISVLPVSGTSLFSVDATGRSRNILRKLSLDARR